MVDQLVGPYDNYLKGPYDDFLSSPESALTPEEAQQAEDLSNPRRNHVAIALGIAGAFYLYRKYMKRTVKEQLKKMDRYDEEALSLAMRASWQAFAPSWASMMINQTTANYALSLAEEMGGDVIPPELLYSAAEQYVDKFGNYMNDSTMATVLDGYQGLVNRKIASRTATNIAVEALGVTHRGMATVVNVATQKKDEIKSNQKLPDHRKIQLDNVIESDIQHRGKVIGDTEQWTGHSQIKQVIWMYSAHTGAIPQDTHRVWKTKADELVCEMCGPMHKQSVPVTEKFKTPAGEMWSPPSHPGCRCEVTIGYRAKDAVERELQELVEEREEKITVDKSAAGDPFNRDKGGRFSKVESRSHRTSGSSALDYDPIEEYYARKNAMRDLARSKEEAPGLSMSALGEEAGLSMDTGLSMGGLTTSGLAMDGGLTMSSQSLEMPVEQQEVEQFEPLVMPEGFVISSEAESLKAPSNQEIFESLKMPKGMKQKKEKSLKMPKGEEALTMSVIATGSTDESAPLEMSMLSMEDVVDLAGHLVSQEQISVVEEDGSTSVADPIAPTGVFVGNVNDTTTYTTSANSDFYDIETSGYALVNSLGTYWDAQIDEIEEEYDYQFSAGSSYKNHVDWDGRTYQVDEQAFSDALYYSIGKTSDDEGANLIAADGSEVWSEVPLGEISRQLRIDEEVEVRTPTILITTHHYQDGLIGDDSSGYNPGNWKVVETVDTEISDQSLGLNQGGRVRIKYVEPGYGQ